MIETLNPSKAKPDEFDEEKLMEAWAGDPAGAHVASQAFKEGMENPDVTTLVLREGGKVKGVATYDLDKERNELHIWWIGTDTGKGYGGKLFSRMEKIAEGSGASMSTVPATEQSEAWFVKQGFKKDPTVKNRNFFIRGKDKIILREKDRTSYGHKFEVVVWESGRWEVAELPSGWNDEGRKVITSEKDEPDENWFTLHSYLKKDSPTEDIAIAKFNQIIHDVESDQKELEEEDKEEEKERKRKDQPPKSLTSGWSHLKAELPSSSAVRQRIAEGGHSPGYLKVLESLERYWVKRGK